MAERSDNVYKNDIQPRSREQFVIGLRHLSAVGYITRDSRFMVDWEKSSSVYVVIVRVSRYKV